MAQVFRAAQFPVGDVQHGGDDLRAHFFQGGFAREDLARIDIHVVGQALEGLRIGAYLDDGRDRRADHGTASGREQGDVGAAGNEFDDFRVVRHVRETEARLAVRHHVEQVQAAAGRLVARFQNADDGRGTALGVGAQRLFFLRGQAAIGVPRREAAMAHDGVVAGGLGHGFDDGIAQVRADGAPLHVVLAAHQFARLFEDAGAAGGDQGVERDADGRVGADAAGAVGAAADGGDDQLIDPHGHALLLRQVLKGPADPLDAAAHAGTRAAVFLDRDRVHGTVAVCHGAGEAIFVEAFAAQGDQQHGAHVRVRQQTAHHLVRVFVGEATRKADQVHGLAGKSVDHQARHVVRAFDHIGHDHDIADALAAIGAQVARQGGCRYGSVHAWSSLSRKWWPSWPRVNVGM
ncbi:hypothetical protein D3C72_1262880 [compost metagenome]